MVFSSLPFLFFYLPVVLLIYKLSPLKLRNLFLLIASLFFYGWGEPIYIAIMFLSIAVDYTHGMLVDTLIATIRSRFFDFLRTRKAVSPLLRNTRLTAKGRALCKIRIATLLVFTHSIVPLSYPFVNRFLTKYRFFAIIFF